METSTPRRPRTKRQDNVSVISREENSHHSRCEHCYASRECLLSTLKHELFQELEPKILHPKPLHSGDKVFLQGSSLTSLYIVQSGSFKALKYAQDGEKFVIGFHFPGDMIGLDALETGAHLCEVSALETSSICVLRMNAFNHLHPETRADLLEQAVGRLANLIRVRETQAKMLVRMSAEQRLACFLVSMSGRMTALNKNPDIINLPMSRNDIANFLGLAAATLSRLFKRFEARGLITTSRRQVHLNKLSELMAIECGAVELHEIV
jgi:CRP/FNR family transcriptional regulator